MSKLTKRELRAPDQVWRASSAGLTWLKERWLWLIIGAVLIFGAIIAATYIRQKTVQKEAAAQHILGELSSLYAQLKLESEAKTTENQDEENLSQIQKSLEELESQYPGSQANAFAEVFRAKIAAKENKWDEAITSLRNYELNLSSSQKFLAQYPLALAYEESARWGEALDTYERLLEDKKSVVRKWAILGKARSLRELGRAAEAITAYDSFLDEFPSAPELAQVRGLRVLVQEASQSK